MPYHITIFRLPLSNYTMRSAILLTNFSYFSKIPRSNQYYNDKNIITTFKIIRSYSYIIRTVNCLQPAPSKLPHNTLSVHLVRSLLFHAVVYRFTTYQDARRVRLVDGLETNILRYHPLTVKRSCATASERAMVRASLLLTYSLFS